MAAKIYDLKVWLRKHFFNQKQNEFLKIIVQHDKQQEHIFSLLTFGIAFKISVRNKTYGIIWA